MDATDDHSNGVEISWEMWEYRNRKKHDSLTNQDKAELDALHREVRREFCMGKRGLNKTDHYKLRGKEWLLEQDTAYLQQWTQDIRQARTTHSRIQTAIVNGLVRQRQCMRRWLATSQLQTQVTHKMVQG